MYHSRMGQIFQQQRERRIGRVPSGQNQSNAGNALQVNSFGLASLLFSDVTDFQYERRIASNLARTDRSSATTHRIAAG